MKDWHKQRIGPIILVVLTFVFLFFSLYKLSESPSVWYDEGIYAQTAANLAASAVSGVRIAPDAIFHISKLSVGYPLLYPLALVFRIFGAGILQGRLLMVLFMAALCSASFLLARKLFGSKAALSSLALIVTFGPLYGDGKSILGEVPGLLFFTLALLFALEWRKSGRHFRHIVLAGICAGLSVVAKPLFLLAIPALFFALLLRRKEIAFTAKDIIAVSLAGLLPILIWLGLQFQAGDTIADIIGFYANPYHYPNIYEIIARNIKGLFTNLGTLYLLGMTALWSLALFVRRSREDRASFEELAAFIFSLLCSLAYLRTSGMLRYIFPPQFVSLIFFPPALFVLYEWLAAKKSVFQKRAFKYIPVLIIVLLSIFGIYQLCFDSWVADFYTSHKTAFWQEYLTAPHAPLRFYYNVPEVAFFDRSDSYYQYLRPAPGLEIGAEYFDLIRKGIPGEIIIQTAEFQALPQAEFSNYRFKEEDYKYSILERK